MNVDTSIQLERSASAASPRQRSARVWLRRAVCAAFVSTTILPLGCRLPEKAVALPTRHSVESDQLLVLSDFKLSKDHELIRNLNQLRDDVATELDLPLKHNRVVVYLFSDEHSYREYLNTVFPGLPNRRAYFVGTSHDLAVYTYWGDRIQEDLRHEYTHGLLHSSMKHVPLWLDEGLAEYFEIDSPARTHVNERYVRRLDEMHAKGWKPDISGSNRSRTSTTCGSPSIRNPGRGCISCCTAHPRPAKLWWRTSATCAGSIRRSCSAPV